MKSSSGSRQHIIWREWLHTEDVKYAAQLLELVADKSPAIWPTIVVMAGSGASLGILLGTFLWMSVNWMLGTRLTDQEYYWNALIFYIIGAGGVIGVLFSLFTWFASTWRYSWATFFTGLRVGLIVGILFGLIDPSAGLIAGGVTGSAWMMGWLKPKTNTELTLLLGSILVIGATLIPLFGLSTDPVEIVILIIALSLGLGLVLSLMMFLLSSEQKKKLKRLSGKLANWFRYNRAITSLAEYLFKSNPWLQIPWSEPPMGEVEAALFEVSTAQPKRAQEWPGLLRRLAKQRRRPPPLDKLLVTLQSGGWKARFIARYTLVAAGGEAVAPLRQFLLQSKLDPMVVRLLKNIALESRQRWANQVGELICPNCLAYCQEHLLPPLPQHLAEIYYGCRICRQSRDFWHCPQGVVAMLDNQWMKKSSYRNGLLRVNALTYLSRFDFDWVEIMQATDQEVERFAIQISNDTDPFRQPRYRGASCTIAADCSLSENTLRILRSLFNSVEVVSFEPKIVAMSEKTSYTVREKLLSNADENFSLRLTQNE